MPLLKTCEAASTDSVSSKQTTKKTTTGKKTFRTITTDHIKQALNVYLRALMMIDKDEEVTHFNKVFDTYEIKVEKMHD